MTVSTICTASVPIALQQPLQRQSWILPDNSLVLALNVGTINFTGAGTNQCILLQCPGTGGGSWQGATPGWVFVKQFSNVGGMHPATWWDGTRLHVAYANISTTSVSGLFYISGGYSGGVWSWDSSPTTLVAASDPTNFASSPSICVDSLGQVFVAYRNQTVASPATTSVCLFGRPPGGAWNSTPSQISATTSTSNASYYGALGNDGATTILVTFEVNAYYAVAHPDGGSWGAAVSGPIAEPATGQALGPMSLITDGLGGAWTSISSSSKGMQMRSLTWSGNAVTWAQAGTTIDAANNVQAAGLCYCNGLLYAFFSKTTATNVGDVYVSIYTPTTSKWSTESNLTNASASNYVNAVVPRNFALSGSVTVMPLVYESGTASPFTISLQSVAPIAQAGVRYVPARLRLGAPGATYRAVPARLKLLTAPRWIPARFALEPVAANTGMLPDNPYGITYGLRSATDTLDIRVAILAAAMGCGWFRIQQNAGFIWQNQGDSPAGWNWASLDDAISKLNYLGFHTVFPLRFVNSIPSWAFTNPAQLTSYILNPDGSHTPNWYAPDPATVATFATAVAARYNGDGVTWQRLYGTPGPIGLNGQPLVVQSIEVGNEEFNQHNSAGANPPTIYGTYSSPYSIYNATSGVTASSPAKPDRDPHFFVPVLQAASPAIWSVYPTARIGMCAIWWMDDRNCTDFIQDMYTELPTIGNLFSYANFHYYVNKSDVLNPQGPPNFAGPHVPSITTAITNIANAMAAAGDGNKPIWITEFGFGTTDAGNGYDCDEATQALRYEQILHAARTSGSVAKIFLYTLRYNNPSETSSLIQAAAPNLTFTWRYLQAFYTWQRFTQKYPFWLGANNALVQAPSVSRRSGQGPSISRRG